MQHLYDTQFSYYQKNVVEATYSMALRQYQIYQSMISPFTFQISNERVDVIVEQIKNSLARHNDFFFRYVIFFFK